MLPDQISILNPPAIPGLVFRHFRGEADYPGMALVLNTSEQADQIERQVNAEMIASAYQKLVNCDPYQDMIFVEVDGELVGYGRGWWEDESPAEWFYKISAFILPAWRRMGIGRALQSWMERRMRSVAAAHPLEINKMFDVTVFHHQVGKAKLLEEAGYQPERYFYTMVRPTLDDIPDFPLPAGVELRPASPEHYRAIWKSIDETSQDEWGYIGATEEIYQHWLADPHFQPGYWQIAWDVATNEVCGHVLTFIDEAENRQFNRQRGYTEGVGVNRSWRRKGLARAMIIRSLQVQKEAGMTESALAADSDSQSGVISLYQSCGFEIVNRDTLYRKPLQS